MYMWSKFVSQQYFRFTQQLMRSCIAYI